MSGSTQNQGGAAPTQPGSGMNNDRALADVLDRLRNRFFGKYRGIVADADAATMRVKATVPAVLGLSTSGWARPSVPFAGPKMGFCFLPAIGSGVWVEFEAGDVSLPIWSGCYWFDGEQPGDASTSVLAIVTSAGQKILCDTAGNTITISDSNGNTVTMDSSGITMSNGSGTAVVGPSGVNINNGALQVT